MFPCLKCSCSVNDLADSQALYITKNMLGILVRGNAPAPRKPEVQNKNKISQQTHVNAKQ